MHRRFFYALVAIGLLFFLSYWFHMLYPIAWMSFWALVLVVLIDIVILFRNKHGIEASRVLADKLSNSDLNPIIVTLKNAYPFSVAVEVIDEIPIQFQKRDFLKTLQIPAKDSVSFQYELRPVERGEYFFGHLNVFVSSRYGIIKRRYTFDTNRMVKVYPSFVQMKKYAFLALDNRLTLLGMKKMRRIGHTMEFEQIKEYVIGDDVRTINWKATAKHADLMINQFQDEKSQPIYCLIDASRAMKMPFEGLSLLDYAINSTLAFSNIALKKKDKVGMITFAENIKNHLPASSRKAHLNTILEVLYNSTTDFLDADFSRLYTQIKRKITQRSLLLLFTNFEHISALERQLGYLKALSRKHILVVIFFKNTELDELLHTPTSDLAEVYHKTIAQKADYDKKVMAATLEKYGIQTILTKPQDLTVNTINKYLEIKARGML